ncbi:hypothetical protein FA15DRAFT_756849 [Coprinopsis marcescibilis]|uniref:Uncharacterized protein n=1 Tax=Coprinopsis marcescibilis TaxID=230819 RepID=A0A5C3KVY0_COPMA|nr:hypothetical protein FA15DRAFT_756849 [Coprinopsis marcescibilis]
MSNIVTDDEIMEPEDGAPQATEVPTILKDPYCHGLEEIPTASKERSRVAAYLQRITGAGSSDLASSCGSEEAEEESTAPATTSPIDPTSPLFTHLEQGLALTTGSALGSAPPSTSSCLQAFLHISRPKAGLTAGARAWSKHAHRSHSAVPSNAKEQAAQRLQDGWWGPTPSGPVAKINERAVELFWRILNGATWRNLHWLPHEVLVYEIRVPEGYGMRWSQDRGKLLEGDEQEFPWVFRGFVEPMMENGHELGWRHAPINNGGTHASGLDWIDRQELCEIHQCRSQAAYPSEAADDSYLLAP